MVGEIKDIIGGVEHATLTAHLARVPPALNYDLSTFQEVTWASYAPSPIYNLTQYYDSNMSVSLLSGRATFDYEDTLPYAEVGSLYITADVSGEKFLINVMPLEPIGWTQFPLGTINIDFSIETY